MSVKSNVFNRIVRNQNDQCEPGAVTLRLALHIRVRIRARSIRMKTNG